MFLIRHFKTVAFSFPGRDVRRPGAMQIRRIGVMQRFGLILLPHDLNSISVFDDHSAKSFRNPGKVLREVFPVPRAVCPVAAIIRPESTLLSGR